MMNATIIVGPYRLVSTGLTCKANKKAMKNGGLSLTSKIKALWSVHTSSVSVSDVCSVDLFSLLREAASMAGSVEISTVTPFSPTVSFSCSSAPL